MAGRLHSRFAASCSEDHPADLADGADRQAGKDNFADQHRRVVALERNNHPRLAARRKHLAAARGSIITLLYAMTCELGHADEPWRIPGDCTGRQDRRRLGLGPFQAHHQARDRQPRVMHSHPCQ